MDLHVSLDGRRDLAGQIYRRLRAAILDGGLRAGDPLPATRELAQRLDVARNTVLVAYDRLIAEGFAAGRVGAGTFVCDGLPLQALRTSRDEAGGKPDGGVQPRDLWRRMPPTPDFGGRPEYDFRVGVGDATRFPYSLWRRLVADEFTPSRRRIAGHGEPAGESPLRTAIARHVSVSRSVQATPDDVVVTGGTQQAIDLIAKVLVDPGSPVAVEDPGYPPVWRALQANGAMVEGVPVDSEGMVVDAVPDGVRLVVVSPSHQFPLGVPMSLSRRLRLLAWAERRNAVIVEDDYDGEFRYAGRPLEPLQSLDRTGRVIYIGSFSKSLLPTLRLGFLVAPPSLREALRKAKFASDWCSPVATQLALARFIDDGMFAQHVRKMRNLYRRRHERILDGLESELGTVLEPISSTIGLHITALSRGCLDDIREVVEPARNLGVAIHGLSHFAVRHQQARSGIVIGYGAIAEPRIDEGLRLLASVLR